MIRSLITAVFVCQFNLWIKLILCLGVIFHGYYLCRYKILKQKITTCYLVDDQWILKDQRGKEHIAQLLGNSIVTTFMIILNFKRIENKKCESMVLYRDTLPKTQFRQLRVLLLNLNILPRE